MKRVVCNLCGSSEYINLYSLPDINLSISKDKFHYVECLNCGLVYQNPQLEPSELLRYYPIQYSCYQSIETKSGKEWFRKLINNFGFRKRWNFILSEISGGTLLDVGCATGNFLQYKMKDPNWRLKGLEINEKAADIARAKGVDVDNDTLEQARFESGAFDAVTLWDVLEHVNNPRSTLSEVARILRKGGIIVLRVPRIDSWDYKLFRESWYGFESPRHLYIFSTKTISSLIMDSGFTIHKMSGEFGGYLNFVMDIKFLLIQKGLPRKKAQDIENILRSPFFRILFSPLLAFIGLILNGPSLTIVASKE